MISIATEIWIELAFLIIFLFLPFPDPSLRPAKQLPSRKCLGQCDSWASSMLETHSLGLMAGLSEEAEGNQFAQRLMFCGQLL